MPKVYDNTIRRVTAEERPRLDITGPHFVWPPHRRARVAQQDVTGDPRPGDVITVGHQRVCILAYLRLQRAYLVAPDSPGVGLVVFARVMGRMVRRANLGLLHWLSANDLLITPSFCYPSWRHVRIPWRRER